MPCNREFGYFLRDNDRAAALAAGFTYRKGEMGAGQPLFGAVGREMRPREAHVAGQHYTVSFERPLRRRRRRTARPVGVLVRARNPWVRARFLFFGW